VGTLPQRVVAGLILLLGVLAGAVVVGATSPFQGLDDGWRTLLASHRTALATGFAEALSLAGNTVGTTVVAVALAAYWLVRRERALALFVLVSSAAVRALTNLIKVGVDRPRPPQHLVDAAGASFPSGHVSSATVLAMAVALILVHRGMRRRWGIVLITVTAVLMAWDRTYLSVHWLSDTVAGAALGIAGPLLLWPLFARSAAPTGAPPSPPARTPPPAQQ
jgi:membrane-associated phospholipid phosphatase